MSVTEHTGWLLDVYASQGENLALWLLDEDGTRRRLLQPFPVTFYAAGAARRLRAAWRWLRSQPVGGGFAAHRAPRSVPGTAAHRACHPGEAACRPARSVCPPEQRISRPGVLRCRPVSGPAPRRPPRHLPTGALPGDGGRRERACHPGARFALGAGPARPTPAHPFAGAGCGPRSRRPHPPAAAHQPSPGSRLLPGSGAGSPLPGEPARHPGAPRPRPAAEQLGRYLAAAAPDGAGAGLGGGFAFKPGCSLQPGFTSRSVLILPTVR